jgi:hypothetical protein
VVTQNDSLGGVEGKMFAAKLEKKANKMPRIDVIVSRKSLFAYCGRSFANGYHVSKRASVASSFHTVSVSSQHASDDSYR